eukprot:200403-Pyramimonas_sp.AAC.1
MLPDADARAVLVEADYVVSEEAAAQFVNLGTSQVGVQLGPSLLEDRVWPFRPQDFQKEAAEHIPYRIRRSEIVGLNVPSGTRRTGDIQWHLDRSINQDPRYT